MQKAVSWTFRYAVVIAVLLMLIFFFDQFTKFFS
jgi:hypothetical protein